MIERDPAQAKRPTLQQLGLIALAVVVLPIIALLLIVRLVISIEAENIDKNNPDLADAAVQKRLKPVADFVAIDPNAPKVERSGEEIVKNTCAACHASGVLGAPKIGDKAAWAKHISIGFDRLVALAIKGQGQMPPRGGDPSLSDVEVARAVAVMANQSGANFTPPSAPAAPTAANPNVTSVAPSATATPPAAPPVTGPVNSAAQATPANGEAVYKASCASCHATGVAGAPKLGDKNAWAARIKNGKATLYQSALKGKNAMPAKGGNMNLSDAEVKLAVDYMVAQSP